MKKAFAVARTLLVATVFLSIWLYWLPRWFANLKHTRFEPRNGWGWPLLAVGLVLGFWCALEFALRGFGTPAPFDPPRRLVITGLYRWMRNPMYFGLALALIGETILMPQIALEMIIMMAVLSIAVSVMVLAYEEPALRRSFGAEYEEYCREVPRWIPRLRPFDKAKSAA